MNVQPNRLIVAPLGAAFSLLLLALILPRTQWVSDGSVPGRIRVIVLDATRGIPIPGATVNVARGRYWDDDDPEFTKSLDQDSFEPLLRQSPAHVTDEHGEVTITWTFTTGASNKRPVPHAFTRNVHIAVRARRFGGIVVPVRRTEIPSSIVRDQDVRVVVALIPVDP